MRRKGLGLGSGKQGYYNLVPNDPYIHSLSAKGIKSSTPLQPKINSAERERILTLSDDTDVPVVVLRQIETELNSKIDDIETTDDSDVLKVIIGNDEYYLMDYEKAEKLAEERVREDLEDEPELFNQDWLSQFLTIGDTDRSVMAGDEADSVTGDMTDQELLERAGYDVDYDELQDQIDELDIVKDDDKIDELEEKQEDLVDKARDEVYDEIYDEWEEGLKNPIEFLVEEQGIYTKEDLLKASFMSIDIDEATDDAITTDGWEHFISPDEMYELKENYVLIQTNYVSL